jgi:GrpB-like predicted nucleotidyltransferase (UPF0157 family)
VGPATGALGLESGAVRVVPYDERWPVLFREESDRLHASLRSAGLHAVIEHVGSTAVPGLAAKPVLDIAVGHPVDADVSAYIAALTGRGYSHRGEQGVPGREFFRRGEPRSYHVHLTAVGNDNWWEHITFRDRLRADVGLRDAYANLKRDLAARFPRDRAAYIAGKEKFVMEVLRSARL